MARPDVFYVLGAGASGGLVPVAGQIGSELSSLYLGIGSYPAEPSGPSMLRSRIFCFDGKIDDIFEYALLQNAPEASLLALMQKLLLYNRKDSVPSQYRLLRYVGRPSTILNFNLDGLATEYLRDVHRVIEAHGHVDFEWILNPMFDDLVEWGMDPPPLTPKHLWGPEPTWITSKTAYIDAWPRLRSASAVVVIGYSFGCSGRSLDDSESFEWISAGLDRSLCPIFIVDPNPEPVAGALSSRISDARITMVRAKWGDLANCLMALSAGMRTRERTPRSVLRLLEDRFRSVDLFS